ncbi:MAG TPA: hypothetical protein VKU40_12505, partial [Thermoanaerobaculia bacterium]|nr:hypothetical protein [Thermoanaerobaculia bacterium]
MRAGGAVGDVDDVPFRGSGWRGHHGGDLLVGRLPLREAGAGRQPITEVGTDGTSELEWSYTWTSDDLTRIDRPDGTAWVMTYGDTNHPGYLTRLELEGTNDTSTRVES